MAADEPKRILDGYKVIDFSQVLAGPTVTRLMAELGAEVIKVELPPGGDRSRGLPFLLNGRSGYFVQQNRGKRSLCIDLKNPKGHAVVRDLLAKADVMVENFAPGVIKRLGFGYETVHELNPRLVMCSISLCGQAGPFSFKPGFDHIGAALAGVLDMTGEADGPPLLNTMGVGDVSSRFQRGAGRVALPGAYRERPMGRRLARRQLFPLPRCERAGAEPERGQDQAAAQRCSSLPRDTGRNLQEPRGIYPHRRSRPSMARLVPRDGASRHDR
jgi:hypothetical protein